MIFRISPFLPDPILEEKNFEKSRDLKLLKLLAVSVPNNNHDSNKSVFFFRCRHMGRIWGLQKIPLKIVFPMNIFSPNSHRRNPVIQLPIVV